MGYYRLHLFALFVLRCSLDSPCSMRCSESICSITTMIHKVKGDLHVQCTSDNIGYSGSRKILFEMVISAILDEMNSKSTTIVIVHSKVICCDNNFLKYM
ncbi:hypothetical protein PR001_g24672 [Phytophthora rubi]|uniref:Secreted protein n=1 Tax=Phytophthora rubi TaxID=129364 RepID=A0A6A3I7T2_9STRA|nr:hypothetical protein PR001_g24672 [Phytophthora rubi]